MPTEGVGAIGSMDCSPEDRKKMARRYVELAVTIRWTGLLDWTTGPDYWTGLLDSPKMPPDCKITGL